MWQWKLRFTRLWPAISSPQTLTLESAAAFLLHWPGFAVPWKLLTLQAVPYSTTILGDRVTIGDVGIRVFGLLWLVAIAMYIVAGLAIWARTSWAVWLVVVTTLLSLAVSLVNQPLGWEGVVLDALILGVLAFVTYRPIRQGRYT